MVPTFASRSKLLGVVENSTWVRTQVLDIVLPRTVCLESTTAMDFWVLVHRLRPSGWLILETLPSLEIHVPPTLTSLENELIFQSFCTFHYYRISQIFPVGVFIWTFYYVTFFPSPCLILAEKAQLEVGTAGKSWFGRRKGVYSGLNVIPRNFSFRFTKFKVCQHCERRENSFLSCSLWALQLACGSGRMWFKDQAMEKFFLQNITSKDLGA